MENSLQSAYPTGDHRGVQPEYGISKLEYFAGIAMQGLISKELKPEQGAKLAIIWAKELLSQLENNHAK